jgi:translation initiation factor IF-2
MLESIQDELLAEFNEKKLNEVIYEASIEPISNDDMKTGKESNCVIFLFNIDLELHPGEYNIGIRKHKLIYNVVEEIKYFILESDLIDPEIDENNTLIKGRAIVKDVFKIKHNSNINQVII